VDLKPTILGQQGQQSGEKLGHGAGEKRGKLALLIGVKTELQLI